MICTTPPPLAQEEPENAARFAADTSRLWVDRKQLYVSFLNGSSKLQDYVRDLLCGPWGWNAVCGLQFVFDEEHHPDARVEFVDSGASWAYLGTDSLWVPDDKPTISLNIHERDLGLHTQRPTLHEFGHTLGFIHGQLSPLAGALRREQVYEFYEGRGWSRAQVDAQILSRYRDDVLAVADDWSSIMYYWMPGLLWEDNQDRPGNSYISAWDAYGAELIYGPSPVPWHRVWLPTVMGA